jgi:hypothetical protein
MRNIVSTVLGQFRKFFGVSFALYACISLVIMRYLRQSTKWWIWSDIEKVFTDIMVFALIAGAVIVLIDIIPKLSSVVKCLIKAVLIYGDFYLWMLKGTKDAGQILLMSTVYLIVFFVIVGISALLKLACGIGKKDVQYENIYSEKEAETK